MNVFIIIHTITHVCLANSLERTVVQESGIFVRGGGVIGNHFRHESVTWGEKSNACARYLWSHGGSMHNNETLMLQK